MRAMRGRKGIVDVKVTDLGQRVGKGRIVLFLARVKAGILEHRDVAGGEHGDACLRPFPDTVGDEHHRSEEHTSELQSLMRSSYAVFCLKKKKKKKPNKKLSS